MTANIRVIHAQDFIKATPEGWLDRKQSMKLLLDIAAVAPESGNFHVILDTRKAQSGLSEIDLWFLASELSKHFRDVSQSTRVAVLCQTERFNQAEFFALCANNEGFNISAFTSYEDAYEWLTADDG
jgi:hypothetical protein